MKLLNFFSIFVGWLSWLPCKASLHFAEVPTTYEANDIRDQIL